MSRVVARISLSLLSPGTSEWAATKNRRPLDRVASGGVRFKATAAERCARCLRFNQLRFRGKSDKIHVAVSGAAPVRPEVSFLGFAFVRAPLMLQLLRSALGQSRQVGRPQWQLSVGGPALPSAPAARLLSELVAEIGSAFLCAELGITRDTRADHAQYIANWLQLLKDDPKAIFTAAAKASEAVTWLKKNQPH